MGKKDDVTVVARKILSSVWSSCQLKGRCWGKKNIGNCFGGTNITLARDDEIISVCKQDGILVLHEVSTPPPKAVA